MAKVHLFPLLSNVYSDTRLPLQFPGNSAAPAASQVTLATLLAWVNANLAFNTAATVATATHTMTIPAGKWLVGIAVQSSSAAQAFKAGLSSGTDELVYDGIVDAGDVSTFSALLYGGTTGKTIHFSALTGTVTITLLIL
jgi:hypothetical protein